jgi:hypothetical protein
VDEDTLRQPGTQGGLDANLESIRRQKQMENPMEDDINEQSLMRNKPRDGVQQSKPGDFDDTALAQNHFQKEELKANTIGTVGSSIQDNYPAEGQSVPKMQDHRKNFIMAEDLEDQEQILPKTNNFKSGLPPHPS